MPRINIIRATPIKRTVRVIQCEGIFDISPLEQSSESWTLDLELPETWNIGLIVGPSGSGKSTMLRELYSDSLTRRYSWSDSNSIVDDFPKSMGVREIVELLCSVGFSSPPSWLRPFRVLSNGEQFRVALARALTENDDTIAIDEFSSVVDRTVAQISSSAFQRTVRRRNQQAVLASCHYDIIDWLEPDWIFEPHLNKMQRGRLWRRPKIDLKIYRVHHSAWRIFRKHHYLDTDLNHAAICFVALWQDRPVAFSAWLNLVSGSTAGKREHRTVTLPDFQGIGIGNALSELCAALWRGLGFRAFSTTSHPAMIRHRNKSPLWNMHRAPAFGAHGGRAWRAKGLNKRVALHRLTAGFEFVGPALNTDLSRRILAAPTA